MGKLRQRFTILWVSSLDNELNFTRNCFSTNMKTLSMRTLLLKYKGRLKWITQTGNVENWICYDLKSFQNSQQILNKSLYCILSLGYTLKEKGGGSFKRQVESPFCLFWLWLPFQCLCLRDHKRNWKDWSQWQLCTCMISDVKRV